MREVGFVEVGALLEDDDVLALRRELPRHHAAAGARSDHHDVAVEHRVTVVRAANTGVSAFIAPTGQIIRRLPLFERSTMTERVSLRSGETVYSRFGDWFAYLALCVTTVSLAARARSRVA